MGLHRLGHDVYFLEDSDDYPSCYDPSQDCVSNDPSYGLRFINETFAAVGLHERWAYYDSPTKRWYGPCGDKMTNICSKADLVLNISNVNPLRPWTSEIPIRVLIDTDPVFTQIRHLSDSVAREKAAEHTHYYTFGENFRQPGCSIPDDGFPWKPTRQPVVLDAWPVTRGNPQGRLTTVMQWDSYASRSFNGQYYGMKSDSFNDYMDLPSKTTAILEIALGSQSAPRTLLSQKGWLIRNPLKVTKSTCTYQEYIRQSMAEFSVAKHGYVISHSGWFSERSACYLASGRAVVTQDTGFSRWVKTGKGILSFKTQEEALAQLDEIHHHYDDHCYAARKIAEEFFDSRRILSNLIEDTLWNDG
jgi:hypothetical protein